MLSKLQFSPFSTMRCLIGVVVVPWLFGASRFGRAYAIGAALCALSIAASAIVAVNFLLRSVFIISSVVVRPIEKGRERSSRRRIATDSLSGDDQRGYRTMID